jgi:hypothetical protein
MGGAITLPVRLRAVSPDVKLPMPPENEAFDNFVVEGGYILDGTFDVGVECFATPRPAFLELKNQHAKRTWS